MKIGFIGLGIMGTPMALHLAAAGHALFVHTRGKVPDPNSADGRLKKWDTPKRDGYLYAEHFNYTDFEGCMDYKGWERVENLPYERAKFARDDYMETLYGYKGHSKYPESDVKSTNPYNSSPGQVVNN